MAQFRAFKKFLFPPPIIDLPPPPLLICSDANGQIPIYQLNLQQVADGF